MCLALPCALPCACALPHAVLCCAILCFILTRAQPCPVLCCVCALDDPPPRPQVSARKQRQERDSRGPLGYGVLPAVTSLLGGAPLTPRDKRSVSGDRGPCTPR